MPRTIADVQARGYEVGFANGSVAVEEAALAAASEKASPQAIAADVQSVVAEVTVAAAAIAQRDGLAGEELRAYVRETAARAADAAFEQITRARGEAVAFHERAVAVALQMPDVFVCAGPGVGRVYVACKPDGTGWDAGAQEILDSLAADPQ